jgi:GTPase
LRNSRKTDSVRAAKSAGVPATIGAALPGLCASKKMEREILRFTTAGSVDDGKSTLIGRLLHDAGGVYEDQIEAARRVSRDGLDFAFLTDGLRAEREQGITSDVAY